MKRILIIFIFKIANQQYLRQTLTSQFYRQSLEAQNYCLLHVYNSNGIYICKREEMQSKTMAQMNRTHAYAFVEELNVTKPDCVRRHLDNIVKQISTSLNELLEFHCINDVQFRQMIVERSTVRMDYLFFLPDLRQVSAFLCFVSLMSQDGYD